MAPSQLINIIRCVNCGDQMLYIDNKLQCNSCGNMATYADGKIYVIPPACDVVENTKSNIYTLWSSWRKANFKFFKEELELLEPDTRILDLGCGPVQFRNLFSRFNFYVGVDFYPYDLVSVITDIEKRLPFADNSFDVVILSNTLEHVSSTGDVLKEWYRVLRAGGVVLITTPFLMRIHQAPYDFNRYTHFQLTRLLEAASFREIEVKSLGRPIDVYEKI